MSYKYQNYYGLTSIVVAQDNPKYDSRNNSNAIIETASNTLLYGCKNTIIPNGVTSIGEDAFYACSGLTSITIPNSVDENLVEHKYEVKGNGGKLTIIVSNAE